MVVVRGIEGVRDGMICTSWWKKKVMERQKRRDIVFVGRGKKE